MLLRDEFIAYNIVNIRNKGDIETVKYKGSCSYSKKHSIQYPEKTYLFTETICVYRDTPINVGDFIRITSKKGFQFKVIDIQEGSTPISGWRGYKTAIIEALDVK